MSTTPTGMIARPIACQVLRFGIPTLDYLFRPEPELQVPGSATEKGTEAHEQVHGIEIPTLRNEPRADRPNEPGPFNPAPPCPTTSMCIVGPSGTGKSLMALHLASRYYADCLMSGDWSGAETSRRPTIIYASTDLTYERADSTWKKFSLHKPLKRELPFGEEVKEHPSFRDKVALNHPFREEFTLRLRKCGLEDPLELIRKLEVPAEDAAAEGESKKEGEIIFLDMASSTAGDDWGFLARIVSLLRPPPYEGIPAPGDEVAKEVENKGLFPRHLLIIDAVEGLEMLVGDVDAFGQSRSRRSRVAQILRAAHDRCHVVLVLEEDREGDHEPEEYVTDAVLRLRSQLQQGYMRRSLEVVKARGSSAIRGAQNYFIRSGKGSGGVDVAHDERLKDDYHPDDPKHEDFSYIQVVHALHCLTRRLTRQGDAERVEIGPAPKKLPEDELQNLKVARMQSPKLQGIFGSPHGLPRGQVTLLTGDESTHKARFGRAFLAGAFQKEAEGDQSRESEISILITTANESKSEMVEKLLCHDYRFWEIKGQRTENESRISRLFIHRQLEIHNITGAGLFHAVRRCVEDALCRAARQHAKASGKDGQAAYSDLQARLAREWWKPTEFGNKVRLVMEDWSLIRATYPSIEEDDMFAPFLIRYLERMGITTLIIDTQPGRPDQLFNAEPTRLLRSMVKNHLFTWHVSFFGEDRVAISAIPPLKADLPSAVYELRPPKDHELGLDTWSEHWKHMVKGDERLWGDPHFELYRGLESGAAEPVPLKVHLFAAARGFPNYTKQVQAVMDRVFVPQQGESVIVPQTPGEYASLREFFLMRSRTRIGHSVVLQVDEYWPTGRMPGSAKRGYLQQRSVDRYHFQVEMNDPFGGYQPEIQQGTPENCDKPKTMPEKPMGYRMSKGDFFHVKSYGSRRFDGQAEQKAWVRQLDSAGLVPYLWDFGFLMLRKHAWDAARAPISTKGVCLTNDCRDLVEAVWSNLTNSLSTGSPANSNWSDFALACRLVARVQGASDPLRAVPFDIELLSPQTLACLVLEIWSSEIDNKAGAKERLFKAKRTGDDADKDLKDDEPLPEPHQMKDGLHEWLAKYPFQFLVACLLLGEMLDVESIVDEKHHIRNRPPTGNAVAERHWYSTASRPDSQAKAQDPLIPARLPGLYTTRGDWFLTVVSESRSIRQGERAIDLLSRRRGNFRRLEHGVGLPVRDIFYEEKRGEVKDREAALKCVDTAVCTVDGAGNPRPLNYYELTDLGAVHDDTRKSPLNWLWRSQIPHYAAQDRIFEKWIGRFLAQAALWKQSLHAVGADGFGAADLLSGCCYGTQINTKTPLKTALKTADIPAFKYSRGRTQLSETGINVLCDISQVFEQMLQDMRRDLQKMTSWSPFARQGKSTGGFEAPE